jgi:hypothetical protein
MEKKIIHCRITEQPKSLFDPIPKIFVTLEGETEEQYLLEYYPDEISFTEEEITGLTISEVRTLHFQKDKRYLQS